MDKYQLFEGRPKGMDCTELEERIYNFLDSLDITYKSLKHPPAYTMEECRLIRDKISAPVAKNLFLTNKQQSQFYLLILPAEKVFKTKYLSSQINSARLSFATEEHMATLLGVKPGSVTPLSLINDKDFKVKLLIDEDLRDQPLFACHPGINSASVVFPFDDLINRIIPNLKHPPIYVSLPWNPE